ncbi:transmembrane protein 135-like [Oscarella lobularis]|uniref:transmembrane protein 135-like n=1 Tax=Oscarella lobularis TaxID=121494 RepID=UPI0033144061
MTVFSKLTATCHEAGHPWSPSCLNTASEIGVHAFVEGLRLYLPFYLIGAIWRRKTARKALVEAIRSSMFLSANGANMVLFHCALRRLLGCYYTATAAFLPNFIGSFLALLVERKSRRGLLAFYVANMGIDTLFRMLKFRGFARSIPCGDVWMFCLAMGSLMYLSKTNPSLREAEDRVFKLFVEPTSYVDVKNVAMRVVRLVRAYLPLPTIPPQWSTQRPSSIVSTILNSVNTGCSGFVLGYLITAAFSLAGSLSKILFNPRLLKGYLFSWWNFRMGCFLGSFNCGYRLIFYVLRSVLRLSVSKASALAGCISGLSMFFVRSSAVSLYSATKAIEFAYAVAVHKGKLPSPFYYADALIYGFFFGIMVHAAILESHNLTPRYKRLLLKLTANRIREVNSKLLDQLGTKASLKPFLESL